MTLSENKYTEKIHAAINFINEHLAQEITLDQIAAAACFSPYHFHRIFTSFVGETPRCYIERIKLEKAANTICLMPQKPIADIAYEFGFSSASIFSRAFKRHFNLSPRKYLLQHIIDFHSDTPTHSLPNNAPLALVDTLVRFERLPAMHLAYTQTFEGYATGIPKAWAKLLGYASVREWINPQTLFVGLPFDNPGITPREKCRYRACISVDSKIQATRGFVKTLDLKEAYYAIFHLVGQTTDIAPAYALLYGKWLPQSGYMPDDKPLLELYPQTLHTEKNTKILEYDIALPVVPL